MGGCLNQISVLCLNFKVPSEGTSYVLMEQPLCKLKNQRKILFSCSVLFYRSCRIFNISSKNCVYNVSKMSLPVPKNSEGTSETKPKSFRMFHDDTMRSFFRRLCFSPDGEILIVPAGCMELGENKVINATYLMSRHSLNK